MKKYVTTRGLKRWHLSLIPWWYVLVAIATGIYIPRLGSHFFPEYISSMSKDAMIAFLSAVSTGMMALTAIVFALGLMMITFASTAYSPRLVNTFADRSLLHALGIFTGAFIYTLVALRMVGVSDEQRVSSLIIIVAVAWLLVSIFMLFRLVVRTTMIIVTNVLSWLGRTGARAIGRVYGDAPFSSARNEEPEPARPPPAQTIPYHGPPQYITEIETERLAEIAREFDALIELPYGIGNPVMEGDALALVHGADKLPDGKIRKSIKLESERVIKDDPMYAIRLLVEIAIRALSPAVNDPSTAVQSLDEIEFLLRLAGNGQLDIGNVRDPAGELRLTYPTPTWKHYLELGVLEIQHYGADSVQVERRLGALFDNLRANLPPERRTELERLAEERRAVIARSFGEPLYLDAAEVGDRKGIG